MRQYGRQPWYQLCAAAVVSVRLIRGHSACDALHGLSGLSLEAVDDATMAMPPGGARFENVCSVAVTSDVTVMKKGRLLAGPPFSVSGAHGLWAGALFYLPEGQTCHQLSDLSLNCW